MEVKLIIPALDNDGSDNSTIIEKNIVELCKLYGGATVYSADGFWINEAGRLFKDEVKVLVSAATDKTAAMAQLREMANQTLAATDQEAIYLSVGGDVEIID